MELSEEMTQDEIASAAQKAAEHIDEALQALGAVYMSLGEGKIPEKELNCFQETGAMLRKASSRLADIL